MGYLKYIKLDELTVKQRAELKERLRQEIRGLQAAVKAADRALQTVSAAPKLKKPGKRRTSGNSTKGRLPRKVPE